MARYSESLLTQLKAEVCVEALVEQYGVELKPHGADRIGHCPFHDDKTPSLVVSPKNNLWHCLGACQCGGSVIDWVMKAQGVSFRHAVELLREGIPALAAEGSGTAAPSKPAQRSTTQKLDVLLADDADSDALKRQVIDYYHETLLGSPEAMAYLDQRGLNHPELISHFKLGYANRTLGYRLPAKTRKQGAALRGALQAVGLLRDSGHEHFTGSLIIPVLNDAGDVLEIYGRKIQGQKLRKGTAQHLYLPGPHAGVWNTEGLIDQQEVILCESLIDAMTFWVHGYRNVTASYGTAGFTADHLACFSRLGVKRVLIAYDRDAAGDAAADKLAKRLQAEGFGCYRLQFPKNMDANQYAQEVTPAGKSLGVVIRSAQWLGEGDAPSLAAVSTAFDEAPAVDPIEGAPETLPQASDDHPALDDEVILPAAAAPPAPENLPEPEVLEDAVRLRFGDRCYRVRGLDNNKSYDVLKVNLLLRQGETVLHVDTFDLYSAKSRQAFARVASLESGLAPEALQRELGQVLLQLERLQDTALAKETPVAADAPLLTEDERDEALLLLQDPALTERLMSDIDRLGLVGEPTNALMAYLAVVSRKLRQPLAIIVQSTSAAGKSALMDTVLTLVPDEDRVHYSAMTGQSLFYLGETNLKHKVLAIAEEEGVRQAAYALKLLQSQGELTIASTGKDPQSGKLITQEYRVEGPVMLFLTTTAIDIDEELLNRCVVLTINESRSQTAAIQKKQRQARTLQGLLAREASSQLLRVHHNAQRLLRPVAVVNPYAEELAFADSQTRTRRDHEKYLTLIDSIALLHQYQRPTKRAQMGDGSDMGSTLEYIEVLPQDIALANRLAHAVLGRSLDELPPPTRRLLGQLHAFVSDKATQTQLRLNEVRFTRRELREAVGLSDKQVRVHLERLVELEYVLVHYGRNGQRFVYELTFTGEVASDQRQLMGLIDAEQLAPVDQQSDPIAQPQPTHLNGHAVTTPNLVVCEGNLGADSWPARGPLGATLAAS